MESRCAASQCKLTAHTRLTRGRAAARRCSCSAGTTTRRGATSRACTRSTSAAATATARGGSSTTTTTPRATAAAAARARVLDLFERFLFLGDDRNIQRVYVGGRVVVARDGSSTANGE